MLLWLCALSPEVFREKLFKGETRLLLEHLFAELLRRYSEATEADTPHAPSIMADVVTAITGLAHAAATEGVDILTTFLRPHLQAVKVRTLASHASRLNALAHMQYTWAVAPGHRYL